MSTTTLPKSVQAQVGNAGANTTDESTSSQDRAQQYREFVEKIRHMPDDFLRIPASYYPAGHTAIAQSRAITTRDAPLVDMVDISVVEAQLVKNYGLLRMDLYCKIRVGHMVCETQTCLNGARNPKWDGVFQFSLKPGIDSFHLEIYDEKQFSVDEKIAWLYEPIPTEVFRGITVERWFPLSGRLGQNKEGSVLLVLSHKRMPMRASNFGRSVGHGTPMALFVPAGNQVPMINGQSVMPVDPQIAAYIQPPSPGVIGDAHQQQLPGEARVITDPARPVNDDDVNQLSEMFPSIDKAVIRAVLENNHNNKESAISALLALG